MTLTISLFFSFSFLFFHVDAFNITKTLSQFPDFTTFNDYLTRTGVMAEINSLKVLTIFVFDNNAASILPVLPDDSVGKILRAHVALDYYNVRKLESIPNRTTILTTLFQTTGRAVGQQGHLNVTILTSGIVAIGSAVEGAPLNAKLVKPILLQPYGISILQVSDVIVPLGVDSSVKNSSSAPSPISAASPSSIPGTAAGITVLPPSPTPSATGAATPRKSLSPSPTPTGARAPAPRNLLPPSPTPMATRAPTPRNPLPPSPTPATAAATSPRNSLPPSPAPARKYLPPSPTPTAGGPRKSLSPSPATDHSPSSTSTPSDFPSSNTSPTTPLSPSPINIIDALPSPPSTDNSSSSAGRTIWFRVVATMIIVATTLAPV